MIKALKHLITLGCCVSLATVVQAAPPSSGMTGLNTNDLFSSTDTPSHHTDSLQQPLLLNLSMRQTRHKKIPPFNPFGKRRRDHQVIV